MPAIAPEDVEAKPRINVTLTKKTYEELKAAARRSDLDVSQFIRNALRVYYFLLDETAQDKSLYIGKDGKIEKQVVMP